MMFMHAGPVICLWIRSEVESHCCWCNPLGGLTNKTLCKKEIFPNTWEYDQIGDNRCKVCEQECDKLGNTK